MTPFSVLLPVYFRDRSDHLRRAFASSVTDQTLRPDEVVVVCDGPLGARLQEAVEEVCADSPVPLRRVTLPRNVGLGPALNAGLAACTHDVVARMDADDVSLPQRFARQLPVIDQGADIVGSALLEFDEDEDDIVGVRTPPLTEPEITSWSRFHQPFNHPTVVFRKSLVQAVGGYEDVPLLEDYWLFARLIARGARVANVPEPLVKYRVGEGAFSRRGGLPMLRSELRLQHLLYDSGFTTRRQYARNLVVRGGYRLVPEAVRRHAYRSLIAGRGRRSTPVV